MEKEPETLFSLLFDSVLSRLEPENVPRGTTIIAEGSQADAIYLVATGRFRVNRSGVDLDEIGPRSVVGEIAFLTGRARTANVSAARDSAVYRIDRATYDMLCTEHPDLSRALARELAERLARTSGRVRPERRSAQPRTYCILPAAGAPLPERFMPELAAAMAEHGPVKVITEADLSAVFGPEVDPASAEAVAWLNAQERDPGLVLFVANPEAGPWTRAALHQADQVVLIAQAVNHQPPSEPEALAMEMMPPSQRRLVLVHPHRMQRARGTGRWLDSRPVAMHHHVTLTGGPEDIARLARFLSGRAVGMVLSGGGAFGVAHVGVYRAMRELGLPVDIVGGTSVGSAMAGAIALSVPPAEIGPRVEQIFVRSGAMRRFTLPKVAFLDHAVLDAALLQHFGPTPIEDLWLPYFAVAADLSAMERVVLRRGPLWEAIRASSAIPGVLPPFFTPDGQALVDGGCVDNMPLGTMQSLKTGPNVVVNVQKATEPLPRVDYRSLPKRGTLLRQALNPFGRSRPSAAPGPVSTVMRSLLMGQDDLQATLGPTDVMIRPPGLKGAGFLAWNQHKLFYEMAYQHALEVLDRDRTPAIEALTRLRGSASGAPLPKTRTG